MENLSTAVGVFVTLFAQKRVGGQGEPKWGKGRDVESSALCSSTLLIALPLLQCTRVHWFSAMGPNDTSWQGQMLSKEHLQWRQGSPMFKWLASKQCLELIIGSLWQLICMYVECMLVQERFICGQYCLVSERKTVRRYYSLSATADLNEKEIEGGC